jgi:hypothetical protein
MHRISLVALLLLVAISCGFLVHPAVAQNTIATRQNLLPDRTAPRQPRELWAPADIDAAIPAVTSRGTCLLSDVLDKAGNRIQETINNLDRFTATERVEHRSVSGSGNLGTVETRKFEYVVTIGPGTNGLTMQEYRRNGSKVAAFPDRISTEGTPSLVLVFHPLYAKDFQMKCEGLGSWNGRPAWQVRFEQRENPANRLSNIVVNSKSYGVRLRGRAWILASSYQVARIETDLAETIPSIQLRLEHLNVEYRPVWFAERKTELWLPSSAQLYLDFAGHRFYRKHSFGDFTLFSVDVSQQFTALSASVQ